MPIFPRCPSAPPDDVAALAKWLISEGVLSRYQARVLLAGRAGPFWLGDYKILDRHGDGQIKGLYEAICPIDRRAGVAVGRAARCRAGSGQAAGPGAQSAKGGCRHGRPFERDLAFAEQGSLTFAVLSEFSPPAVVEPVAPPPLPERPAEDWAAEIPIVAPRPRRRRPVGIQPCRLGSRLGTDVGRSGAYGGRCSPNGEPTAVRRSKHRHRSRQIDGASRRSVGLGRGETAEARRRRKTRLRLEVRRPAGAAEPAVELIADDGQTLWASPTSGPPLNLSYLPAGAQAVLVLRPAELMGSAEGAKMFEAIGPASVTAATTIQAITFCQWPEIEQLQIATLSGRGRSGSSRLCRAAGPQRLRPTPGRSGCQIAPPPSTPASITSNPAIGPTICPTRSLAG